MGIGGNRCQKPYSFYNHSPPVWWGGLGVSETPPPGLPRQGDLATPGLRRWLIERRCGAWEYAVEPLCAAKSTEIPPKFSRLRRAIPLSPFHFKITRGSCDCTIGTTVTCVLDTHGRGRVRFPRSTIVTLDICMVTTVLQKRARTHINTNGITYQYRQWQMATSVNDSFTTMVMVPCAHRDMMCAVL